MGTQINAQIQDSEYVKAVYKYIWFSNYTHLPT